MRAGETGGSNDNKSQAPHGSLRLYAAQAEATPSPGFLRPTLPSNCNALPPHLLVAPHLAQQERLGVHVSRPLPHPQRLVGAVGFGAAQEREEAVGGVRGVEAGL